MRNRLLALVVAVLAIGIGVGLFLVAGSANSGPNRSSPDATSPIETSAVETSAGASGMRSIREIQLPAEGRSTLALIAAGGPFPYRQDGGVFQNREKRLPKQSTGYYREYTVKTPGSPDRGARRIITGKKGDKYYTSDHYASFKQIVET